MSGSQFEAEQIMLELIKLGAHEGDCDNGEDKTEACSIHLEKCVERHKKAVDYLRMRGYHIGKQYYE